MVRLFSPKLVGEAAVRASDFNPLMAVKAWSRKFSRRFTVLILALKDSSLETRVRVASDTARSLPISARVCAFCPLPSCVCSLPSESCILEMTL